ncbi:PREDICTED: U4/U6.U5 tri-snRNP-associated protein 1-like [Priapulus caudatus]|uniref:U4/U6.U5 tri-snRNP-associated protein 1-like n=1 Tax=Priapulus caudatus TaxID=37621 RepID=A0ABM1EFK2_PRICU|nr:PREDICTED: U4/U6.U5 tri-snRNP-associated protein 1-like [Priapulus caudatus]
MGSSKRKDRERESKKRHHRDETEEERRERKSKKKRKHDRHKHDKRPRSDDGDRHERQRTGDDIGYVISDGELYEPAPKHRRDDSASSARDQDVAAAVQAAGERESSSHGGGAEMSLGIEETNKLRVSLGLRPLDVTSSDVKKEEKESLKDDVHVPAENLAAKKQAAALKEKLRQIKEKREINKKLQ